MRVSPPMTSQLVDWHHARRLNVILIKITFLILTIASVQQQVCCANKSSSTTTTTANNVHVTKRQAEQTSSVAPDQVGHGVVDKLNDIGAGEQQEFSNFRHQDLSSVKMTKLERRIDWLEFELRKSLHDFQAFKLLQQQQQHQQQQQQQNQNGDPSSSSNSVKQQFVETTANKLSDLSERLDLMEKFVTFTTTKMYEMEQRVKKLEKCECQISCKWSPSSSSSSLAPMDVDNDDKTNNAVKDKQSLGQTLNNQNDDDQATYANSSQVFSSLGISRAQLVKMDGSSWRDAACNVCSCHRGHVTCKRLSCPEPKCDNPQVVAGKCCPVCMKSCSFESRIVRHGDKLVINSNEQACKECVCLDGRFKCQRVNLATQTSGSRERDLSSLPSIQLRPQRHAMEGTDLDPDLDLDSNNSADDEDDDLESGNNLIELQANQMIVVDSMAPIKQRRRLRRTALKSRVLSDGAPLFCPPVECAIGEQIRLENDCCVYCRNFDFCRQFAPAAHKCHPNAECSNNDLAYYFARHTQEHNNETTTTTTNEKGFAKLININSTYTCQCKAGFVGDGQSVCRDIDECLSSHSNDCDPISTDCVNLLGSYVCQCKRGFSALNRRIAFDETVVGQPQLARIVEASAGERRALQKCHDINECADGKLNRCHPQAKCINLLGSYKCQCKRGYLGNGFECHKWFRSHPSVAAYLHRHNSGDQATNEESVLSVSMQPRTKALSDEDDHERRAINLPLNTLGDEVDDDDDDENGNNNVDTSDDLNDDDPTGTSVLRSAPKLSESKWELLKFNYDAGPQSYANQIDQALNLSVNNSNTNPSDHRDDERAHSYLANTRTMFFQPPPLPRAHNQRPWWANEDTTTKTPMISNHIETATHSTDSASNQTMRRQRPNSDTREQNERTTAMNESGTNVVAPISSASKSFTATPLHLPQVIRNASQDNSARRRGTIIASASTSPRGSPSNGRAYMSQQHHSKSLGVSSTAISSSNVSNHLVAILLMATNSIIMLHFIRLEQIF